MPRKREGTRPGRPLESGASMEPRQECRGNNLTIARKLGECFSFNGAAAGMPRKLCTPADASARLARFNGAAAGMPRKLGASRGGPRRRPGFNGAAAGMPRKPSCVSKVSKQRLRFNGAAAGMPRKPPPPVARITRRSSLQWSRGRNAAETRRSRRPAVGGRALQWSRGRNAAETGWDIEAIGKAQRASMEPRQECRGNDRGLHESPPDGLAASMEPRQECRGNRARS